MKFSMMRLMALAAVIGLGASYAEERRTMRADIPFEFRVGKTRLPAGEYTISQNPVNGYVAIVSTTTKERAAVLAVNGSQPDKSLSRLVFNQYGDKYFLTEVETPMLAYTQRLPKTAAEREMAKGAAVEIASVRVSIY